MPSYKYLCESCLYDGEVRKKISEMEQPEACPECGAIMKRQMSAPANSWKCGGNADG